MAVTAWKPAGTGADDASIGTIVTQTPGNISADDNAYAHWDAINTGQISHRLLATNFGFVAGDLPVGCTIDGWEDEYILVKTAEAAVLSHRNFQCVKAGAVIGTAKVDAVDFPLVETAVVKGGAADTWGTTMTRAEALASTTGAALWIDIDAGPPQDSGEVMEHRVEIVRRRYYYTEAAVATTKRTAQKGCSK